MLVRSASPEQGIPAGEGSGVHVDPWTAPSGRTRLLVRMDTLEHARYARAARLAVPRTPAGPRSYGSARRPDRAPRFAVERRAWRADLLRAGAAGVVAETGDVAACFPSMSERALRAATHAAGGDPEPLLRVLRAVWELGITGLPIGPAPSSFLANAVLAIADDAAARAGVGPIRWVDDVVFAGDRAAIARAARAWRHALADLGLRHHEGKRRAGVSAVEIVGGTVATASMGCAAARGIIRL